MVETERDQIAALIERQAYAAAESRLQVHLRTSPDDAQVHHLMALLASATGRVSLALEHSTAAVGLAPGSLDLRLRLACLLAYVGEHERAIPHFRQITAEAPTGADGWYFLGLSLFRLRRELESLRPLRRAYALSPDNTRILEALAQAEFRAGYPADALPLWQALARQRPSDWQVLLRLGETLSRLGQHADAITVYRDALESNPDNPHLWMALAQASEDAGDRGMAHDGYSRALALRPSWPFPIAALLALHRGAASDELVATAKALLDSATLDDAGRALIGYELGKALDGRGAYSEAMASWHAANASRQRMTGILSPDRLQQQTDAIMAVFNSATLPALACSGNDDPRMVFVVGMPRSGTTLTEQIIAAHPHGYGCGELPDLTLAVRNLPFEFDPPRPWPALAPHLDKDALQRVCARYVEAAERNAPSSASRLVDKAPLNFFYLGLVAMLFPAARVVWCRRDPRDVAISIYGENFSLEEKLATSLEGIGNYINQQERLMRHWQSELQLPILELQYETLVGAIEPNSRCLIEFLGLPWDDACLDFHRSERGVQTPSRWQVRQPVHTRSIGRWKNYQEHLAPLLDALEPGTYPAG